MQRGRGLIIIRAFPLFGRGNLILIMTFPLFREEGNSY